MKNVTVEESLNKKLSDTIIVCKEKEKKGKKGTQIIIKSHAYCPIFNDTEFDILNMKDRNITNLDVKEMLELAKTNPKIYCEKIILSQFGDSPILEENRGTSYILPNRYQRYYENCISFENNDFQVYFPDLAMKYFEDFILKLSQKRKEDILKYAIDSINKGIVRNLKFNLFDGFSFKKSSYCYYDKNNDRFHLDPKDVLYYTITPDTNGTLDKQDLENMKKILETFAQYHSGLRHATWNSDELIAYGEKGGSLLIESHTKEPDFLEQVCKLIKKTKEGK